MKPPRKENELVAWISRSFLELRFVRIESLSELISLLRVYVECGVLFGLQASAWVGVAWE